MDRTLCVSNSVKDEDIYSAWYQLLGNNAIETIESGEFKKIHLSSDFLQNLEEDEFAEILDMYEEIETGHVVFYLQEPEWWMYGIDEYENKLHFEVFFV